jgi:hypothetical protein
MKLQCYCCGARLNARFALVALSRGEPVDRVFVMDPEHVARVQDATEMIVQEIEVERPGGAR